MRQLSFNELSFLQLQIFLVAGEELNFTKTATICHVTQPTVSRNIDALEKLTGLQLFNKTHTAMRLTPAGLALHQHLKKSWDMIHSGFLRAWELQEGYSNVIDVNLPVGISPDFVLSAAASYKKKNPDIRTHFSVSPTINQAVHSLFSYETDIVVTHMHNEKLLESYAELTYSVLVDIPLTAFLKRTNPLSCKRQLTFEDLRSQKILFPKDNSEPAYESLLQGYFINADVIPTFSYKTTTAEEAFFNLQDDNEVLILNHFVSHPLRSSHVEIPIKGTRSGYLIVARTSDEKKKHIKNFVDFIKAHCRALDYSLEEWNHS